MKRLAPERSSWGNLAVGRGTWLRSSPGMEIRWLYIYRQKSQAICGTEGSWMQNSSKLTRYGALISMETEMTSYWSDGENPQSPPAALGLRFTTLRMRPGRAAESM